MWHHHKALSLKRIFMNLCAHRHKANYLICGIRSSDTPSSCGRNEKNKTSEVITVVKITMTCHRSCGEKKNSQRKSASKDNLPQTLYLWRQGAFFFFFVPFFWWKIKRPLQQYMAAHSAGGKRQRLTLILLLARSPWSVNINVRETFIHTVCMTPALTKSQPLQLFISKRTDEIVNTKQMLSHLPRSESPPPMKNH